MYKYLILGITFLILGGAGYYFNTSGGGDLVVQALADGDANATLEKTQGFAEVFSGNFSCDEESGCAIPTTLVLNNDTTLEVLAKLTEDYVTIGQGSWGIGNGGALVLVLNKASNASSSYPTSVIAKNIDTMRIQNFSEKKNSYPWMKNPVFTRTAN